MGTKGFRYRLIGEGAVTGLITGALISLFRLMLTGADSLRGRMAELCASGAAGALITAGVLIAAAAAGIRIIGWRNAFSLFDDHFTTVRRRIKAA